MREILFRGKRLDNGEWLEGDLIHSGKCCAIIPASEIPTSDNCRDYLVDPSTVGQYTGLMDKHDKRIFEGDVLEGDTFDADEGYGVVQWDDGAFEINNSATFHENYWSWDLEIIGNIHDNPELIGGGA